MSKSRQRVASVAGIVRSSLSRDNYSVDPRTVPGSSPSDAGKRPMTVASALVVTAFAIPAAILFVAFTW